LILRRDHSVGGHPQLFGLVFGFLLGSQSGLTLLRSKLTGRRNPCTLGRC
jgi:hypothetical protein